MPALHENLEKSKLLTREGISVIARGWVGEFTVKGNKRMF